MTIKKNHVLIIDDDKEITTLLSDYLEKNGYKTSSALSGKNIQRLLKENNFDLVLLDVMMPGLDGLTLCQVIRQSLDIPILMISAAHSTADRVAGLEVGADDYIAKPFSSRELLARIKAQLRRSQGALNNAHHKRLPPLNKIKFNDWLLDRETHSLIDSNAIAIILSQREYELLFIFLENTGRILSRDQLTDLLYDKFFDPQDRTIDVLIGRLRKKIELDPKNPQLLLTVRGGGYQFKARTESL
jgi:two-component system OmpR family response regulator